MARYASRVIARLPHRAQLLAVVAALAACGSPTTTPSGVIGGANRWSFPLVGPLEDGLLVTPVTLDGVGPFLFAIDLDANVSAVDEEVLRDVHLQAVKGPARLDEAGTEQPRYYVELVSLELGTLILERRTAMIVRAHTFDRVGRRLHGVLGRDVFPDAFAFGFDRERGLGQLVVAERFAAPPGATQIPYATLASKLPAAVPPVDRRVATAQIGGAPFAMHLDLGAPASQLREAVWERLQLAIHDVDTAVVDEAGSVRRVARAAVADAVGLGSVRTAQVAFVPYDDRRWSAQEVDGALGLDFFRAHAVWIDWTHKRYHLVPRRPEGLAARIARWDVGAFGSCTTPGCVTVRLIDPVAGRAPDPTRAHPGLVLSITREEVAGGMDLEVMLEAKGRPALPRLLVNLPPGADRVLHHLPPDWLGVQLEVVDASPHPRPCAGKGGCVDLLAR